MSSSDIPAEPSFQKELPSPAVTVALITLLGNSLVTRAGLRRLEKALPSRSVLCYPKPKK